MAGGLFKCTVPFLLVFLVSNLFSRPFINIQYMDEVRIETDEILFRDIALIEGEGPEVEKLKKIRVGRPANFGLTRHLSTMPIYSRYLAALESRYKITGHEDKLIKIVTASRQLHNDSLTGLIGTFIKDYFSGENSDYQYELLSAPDEILVPAGTYKLKMQGPRTYKKLGAQNLNLIIETDKGFIRKLPIKVFIRKYDTVWVAGERIKRGDRINPGQWTREYRDITRIAGEPVRDLLEVSAMRTKQTIIRDRILTTRLIRLEPVVKQGQHVNVSAHSGGITVMLKGVARQDGCLGEIISVKNQVSHKLIKARVHEGGKLELVSMAVRR